MITAALLTDFLVDKNVFEDGSFLSVEPLTGGVSSDICLVTDGRRSVVVKTPLASLKVAGDWQAPLARSDSEADWLRVAARLLPGVCPQVLAHDGTHHLLALSYLDPLNHRLWKNELLEGRVDAQVAAQVGERVGTLQRRSAREPTLATQFANAELFRALRIEPYFEATAAEHADLRPAIDELIATTLSRTTVLAHGDVSPKNILVGPEGPVFLDAETANWGDPAFDAAFCVNHLLLKCLLQAPATEQLLAASEALLTTYLDQVDWESPGEVEHRIAGLLPALMLARVDGRSPVEYLSEPARDVVREFSRYWILNPASGVTELTRAWKAAVG
jgi:5-methylthioribose kinase